MATQTAFIEVKQYSVAVGDGIRWLSVTDPAASSGTWPFYALRLVFTANPTPDQGKLLPSREASCHLSLAAFRDMYHVVQTEKPVYAHIWWEDTNKAVAAALLSTSNEPPGEGFAERR